MITPTRRQRRYDHRLRELVRSTGDIELAVQQGVPFSTARGWVKARQADVVTADVADMEVSQLRQEVLALRQRVARLRAMTRVAFARMKATGSSLPNKRILDATRYFKARREAEIERLQKELTQLRSLSDLGSPGGMLARMAAAMTKGGEDVRVLTPTDKRRILEIEDRLEKLTGIRPTKPESGREEMTPQRIYVK